MSKTQPTPESVRKFIVEETEMARKQGFDVTYHFDASGQLIGSSGVRRTGCAGAGSKS